MGVDTAGYNVFLLLHVLCAIVGLGAAMVSGLHINKARQLPPEQGLAVIETNSFVSMKVADIFVYLVAIFGFGLVGMSDKFYQFSQLWVWLSIVLYIVWLGLSHGAMRPRIKRLVATQRELIASPPTGADDARVATLAAAGKQVGVFSAVSNLIVVAILVLMIWKPGAPLLG